MEDFLFLFLLTCIGFFVFVVMAIIFAKAALYFKGFLAGFKPVKVDEGFMIYILIDANDDNNREIIDVCSSLELAEIEKLKLQNKRIGSIGVYEIEGYEIL